MKQITKKNYKKDEYIDCESYCIICMNEFEEDVTISVLPCNKEYNYFLFI